MCTIITRIDIGGIDIYILQLYWYIHSRFIWGDLPRVSGKASEEVVDEASADEAPPLVVGLRAGIAVGRWWGKLASYYLGVQDPIGKCWIRHIQCVCMYIYIYIHVIYIYTHIQCVYIYTIYTVIIHKLIILGWLVVGILCCFPSYFGSYSLLTVRFFPALSRAISSWN